MDDSGIIISLQHVSKVFDKTFVAVDDVSLDIKRGEFVTLLGPSGCGKTTTLRMIAGFDLPTSGKIFLNGRDITNLPPYERPVNTVFQHYALFPNLDVYDNIAFGLKLKHVPVPQLDKDGNPEKGIDKAAVKRIKKLIRETRNDSHLSEEDREHQLSSLNEELQKALTTEVPLYKMRKLSAKEIDEKVAHALEIVDLEEMEDRDIQNLSGGQQQRVAIARAIVNEPAVLLLDEPLSALDHKMRVDMQLELKNMHKKLGITFIYVTHDQEEALSMSDKVVVMKDGAIQQVGTPENIYNEPTSAYVADFIGESNIFGGTMIGPKQVRFLGANWACVDDFPLNQKVDVVVRPEDVILGEKGKGVVDGRIISSIFKGEDYSYELEVGKNEITCRDHTARLVGSEVSLSVAPENLQIMEKELTSNVYTDAYIDKNGAVVIDGAAFACDIKTLLKGSTIDENGYLVDPKSGKKYDLNDADVIASFDLDAPELSDDLEAGEITGTIIGSVWIGDHYQYIVRTENEEDFVCNTPYQWNIGDHVSVHVPPEKIALRLKKGLDSYVAE